MSERKTNKMCPECDEEYLVEVREPGVPEPVEIFCPACGYTAEVEEEEGAEDEEEAEADYADDLEGIEIDKDTEED